MLFWQLTVNALDPPRLAQFWAAVLGYDFSPAEESDTTWDAHYRGRLGGKAGFRDRIFDPSGRRPPLWFQQADDAHAGQTRLHVDVYPTARDNSLPPERRVELVDAKVTELVELGAKVERSERFEHAGEFVYFVVMRDPENNEFCVG